MIQVTTDLWWMNCGNVDLDRCEEAGGVNSPRLPISSSPHLTLALVVVFFTSPLLAQAPPPPPVAVSKVVQKTVASGQTFVGTVMPARRSVVGSAVEGRVMEFRVNEGDYVKNGEILAQIRTGTLEIELAGAKAELQLRQAELAEMLAGSRQEEKDQAKAKMLGLKARMEYAAAKNRRTTALFERKTISQEDRDEAQALAEEASSAFHEAEAMTRMIEIGPRKEKVDQARAKVLMQEEAIKLIEDRLDKFTVRAYFDGYVVAERTEVGHWVKSGEAIVEIAELDNVDVRVSVQEDHVPHVRKGSKVRIHVGALPDQTFLGDVTNVVPQGDTRSRSFPVQVRLKNAMRDGEHLLKAGMFAEVTFPVGKPEAALLVSKDAIVLGGQSPRLFVVDLDPKQPQQGRFREVPVEIGVADGSLIQVRGALKAGDVVIIRGNERLILNLKEPSKQIVTILETIKPDAGE
jgi:multidrug efflux pump subunit AcrA (membrane-fusion protein)